MKEWIESIKELGERAERKYDEGNFVDLCIIGRKMAEHLAIVLDRENIPLDITDITDFFSKYTGEEDMFKPYLANLWGGIPDEREGEKCMLFIKRIISLIEELE